LTPPRPHKLLTPSDVAELLQISEKTVYKHRERFYGFNPAGLGILRFRGEIIYGIMEGQDPEALVLQFPVSKNELRGQGVSDKTGGVRSQGRKKKTIKSTADKGRHGIF